jgi:hypothetical protein
MPVQESTGSQSSAPNTPTSLVCRSVKKPVTLGTIVHALLNSKVTINGLITPRGALEGGLFLVSLSIPLRGMPHLVCCAYKSDRGNIYWLYNPVEFTPLESTYCDDEMVYPIRSEPLPGCLEHKISGFIR